MRNHPGVVDGGGGESWGVGWVSSQRVSLGTCPGGDAPAGSLGPVQWVLRPSPQASLSLILMSFLLSIFPGFSNRSLIAINHLLKQMSGTMGWDGGGLMKLSGEGAWVAGRWVLP